MSLFWGINSKKWPSTTGGGAERLPSLRQVNAYNPIAWLAAKRGGDAAGCEAAKAEAP